jgi:hypothetical protein
VIVNVAIGSRWNQNYPIGQARLRTALGPEGENFDAMRFYTNGYPAGCPTHQDVPFAFKAYALKEASAYGDQLLWCDACIVPIRSLKPIWDRAEKYGVWLGKNGWKNSDWTADSALQDLFETVDVPTARVINQNIEHVVATAFALDLRHVDGRAFLAEYFRLASETRAFCGPVKDPRTKGGPVPGITHRHDQTAASVIAWRLGIPLTSPPEFFAYRGAETDKTILVADGNY